MLRVILLLPALALSFVACWGVVVVLGLRVLTGEWPDWRAPGSQTAGPVESAWLAEQPTRAERRMAALAATAQWIGERWWFEGAAEIALRGRAAARGRPVFLPDFYGTSATIGRGGRSCR